MNVSVLPVTTKARSVVQTSALAARRSERRKQKEPGLSSELIKCIHKSNFHDPEQEYFPNACVKRLISPDSVNREFRRCNNAAEVLDDEEDKDVIIDQICQHSYKTFAIAIWCGLESVPLLDFMMEYHDRELTDEDLPRVSEEKIRECMDDVGKAHNFCIQRWKFLAPVFSPLQYDYNLQKDCIFPFTKDSTMSRSGGFGTVSRVEIHSDHQNHVGMRYVAIKEIHIAQGQQMLATDKAWNEEAKLLRCINDLKHPNITQCIAAIRRGERRYFMFPWAEGGNLQEYWKKTAKQGPDAKSILQMVEQLRDLADALDALHHCRSGNKNLLAMSKSRDEDKDKSIRHGDIKPENILRFMPEANMGLSSAERELGILKIADMGLAKQHIVATSLRTKTSQRYGTIKYEAPEAITATKGRSRLYDVWSLGCITLEFIIWVLHGNTILEEFYTQVEAGRKQTCQYFELHEDRKGADVHHVVSNWIDRIRLSDPECSQKTAISDLLDVVRNRLLVVNLIPSPAERRDSMTLVSNGDKKIPSFRATAAEFRNHLDVILGKAREDIDYLWTGKNREAVELPRRTDSWSPATTLLRRNLNSNQMSHDGNFGNSSEITNRVPRLEYSLPPLKDWEFPVDNAFAERFQNQVGARLLPRIDHRPDILCQRCSGLDFWIGGLNFPEKLGNLSKSAATCALCRLLYVACKREGNANREYIQVERSQSNLKLTGADLPILSIVRSREPTTPTPIQIGFLVLPEPGSEVFFELIKLWLRDCDTQHAACTPEPQLSTYESSSRGLPTRLIDVGTTKDIQLRLLETREDIHSNPEYIALSHPWGDTKKNPPFSTWRRDERGLGHDIETFKRGIPYHELPATFKDAVDCTRALGLRYLWIDSICIIQGRDGDFDQEAGKMKDVFSRAYCVLAASRATNQYDGFLVLDLGGTLLCSRRSEDNCFTSAILSTTSVNKSVANGGRLDADAT